MKKFLPYFVFLLFACGNEPHENELIDEETDQTEDTIQFVEEPALRPSTSSGNAQGPEDTTNENLAVLLSEPIDLVEYKKEWGGSNSGGIKIDELYEPDTVGFQYRYMLFWKLRSEIKSHPSESDLFNGFRIIVYKYGEHAGNFSDTNEELIAIECSLDNTTLGEFNFYGKTASELEEQIGPPYIEKDDLLIYFHDDRAFSMHFSGDKVDWYKYARLKNPLSRESNIPNFLSSWNG